MNLTLGFIAFFISIVIPGILFRRFFFFAEFSKQFNTKDPVLHSIFFSIIPGIFLQIICVFFYNLFIGFESSYLDVFTIIRDITSDGNKETQKPTENFLNNEIITFLLYSFFVFLFSVFLGWASSRFIRFQKWDKKYKLFRYKNQWYYIFSGEVLGMKKFEEAHSNFFKPNKGKAQDTLLTFADVLVSVSDQNDRKELYSGYVVDYDLKSDDITQLDKIYLIDTHRYKKKEIILDEDGNEKNEKNENKKNKNSLQSRNRIKVPGDIFILKAKNIVNLNLTYIPSLKKRLERKQNEEKKQKFYRASQKLYLLIVLIIIIFHLFYRAFNLENSILGEYFTNTNFMEKILMILFLNQILSFAFPTLDKNKRFRYDFKIGIWLRLLTLFILSLLTYYFILENLLFQS